LFAWCLCFWCVCLFSVSPFLGLMCLASYISIFLVWFINFLFFCFLVCVFCFLLFFVGLYICNFGL